ncbi:MAG: hypothetical protein HC884_07415 [Chloroflexaceae bacterium]|nr:hypothetical protein [Chloroflexaceae bacterium]
MTPARSVAIIGPMKTLSADTHPDVERAQMARLRQMSPGQRGDIALSMIAFAIEGARFAMKRTHPGASEGDIKAIFAAVYYGKKVAEGLRVAPDDQQQQRNGEGMNLFLSAMSPVIDALEHLGVPYYIGGSVASIIHGVPRTTIDVDLVADLAAEHVRPLVQALQATCYLEETMIQEALFHRSSFHIIHQESGIKVDVFLPGLRAFDREMAKRARPLIIAETNPRPFFLASPEDTILSKLEWYAMGNQVSERQWNDVLGILKVQGEALDQTYLRRWATELALSSLLERAIEEAG